MSIFAAAAIAIRLFNPHEFAVDANVHCGAESHLVHVDARGIADLAEGCTADLPLLEISRDDDGIEWQRDLGADAQCAYPGMAAPSFACKSGLATAYVPVVEGATYAWSAEGATILTGATANRVQVQLGDQATAKLTCVITKGDCGATTTTGVISVREPVAVKTFTVPESSNANQPVTVLWSYQPGREPASQLLTGDAFAQPVPLDAAQRSYTFTPHGSGSRTVELIASYARAIVTTPAKRRRTMGGGASATECPSTKATAKIDVRGCSNVEAVIDAPEDVGAGMTFEARIDVENGQKVEWSVENGTIASESLGLVQVTAGSSGEVHLSARVERLPGCFAVASVTLPIILPMSQCTVVPAATLQRFASDCDGVTVRATFTGTPPFGGEWSDGTPFHSGTPLETHEFHQPGTLTIRNFHDATCFGTSDAVQVDQIRAQAQLTMNQSCGVAQMTATFSGTPPFTGHWSDGHPFTTMDTHLERTITQHYKDYGLPSEKYDWWLWVNDAGCPTQTKSNVVEVEPVPHARLWAGPYCRFSSGEPVSVGIYFDEGAAPYTLEWTDGVVNTLVFAGPYDQTVYRSLPPSTQVSTTFELAHAKAGAGCEADMENKMTTLLYRQRPVISNSLPQSACTGQAVPASLQVSPPPGAILHWDGAPHGGILGGQGTANVTFTGYDDAYSVQLIAESSFNDGFCPSKSTPVSMIFYAPGTISNLTLTPAAIAPGGSSLFEFDMGGRVFWYSIALPPSRAKDFHQNPSGHGGTYTDTVGPGTVPIQVNWGDCAGSHSTTINLTIGS